MLACTSYSFPVDHTILSQQFSWQRRWPSDQKKMMVASYWTYSERNACVFGIWYMQVSIIYIAFWAYNSGGMTCYLLLSSWQTMTKKKRYGGVLSLQSSLCVITLIQLLWLCRPWTKNTRVLPAVVSFWHGQGEDKWGGALTTSYLSQDISRSDPFKQPGDAASSGASGKHNYIH